jgi:hypothetical protein
MVSSLAIAQQPEADTAADFDAIVIGAGVSGLYQLYCSSRGDHPVAYFELRQLLARLYQPPAFLPFSMAKSRPAVQVGSRRPSARR